MWQAIGFVAAIAVFVIVMALHERSVRRRFKKTQEETRENRALDQKITRVYKEIEEMLDSFEAYVGEVHDELELRQNELTTLSRQATTLYMQVMQPAVFAPKPQPEELSAAEAPGEEKPVKKGAGRRKKEDPPAENGKPSRLLPRDLAELERLPDKRQKIRFLSGKGLSISEMAREMNIGKGEITLILDLDKS